MRQRKPIRVFYSTLSNRFYASQQYKEERPGVVIITGDKYDVTNDIARLMKEHEIEFTPVSAVGNTQKTMGSSEKTK